MKKILIFHTSVGLGHKSIAENIGFALTAAGYQVRLEDIGKVQEGKFEKYVTAVHQFINRNFPFVWAWLYAWGHYPILPFRVFIARFNYKQTKQLVDEYQPDLIITVQTTASAVIAYLKKNGYYNRAWGIAFSDYHLHPYWLYKDVDFYLANIDEQKQEMVKRGISAEKIFVCGMTVKPKTQVDIQEVRHKLGINPSKRVVLVGAGSLGIGFPKTIFNELRQQIDASIVVVCGKNQELLKEMEQLRDPNFIPLGFYQPMRELYAIADVFVSKPGGLTTAEALQYRLPMIITHWLPGQEELNITYLTRKNLIIARPANLVEAVNQEIEKGLFHNSLEQNPCVKEIVSEGDRVVAAVKSVLKED